MNIVVAARLRQVDRALPQHRNAPVFAPREQDRNADAKSERRVGRVPATLELLDQPVEGLLGDRVAALEVSQLRAPRRDTQSEAFVALALPGNRFGGIELAHGCGVMSLAHRAERAHQMQVPALPRRAGAQRPASGLRSPPQVSGTRVFPDFPGGHAPILRRNARRGPNQLRISIGRNGAGALSARNTPRIP